jgi:glutathione synthase/RimK-type ligase-like ATP-grasp enzyme
MVADSALMGLAPLAKSAFDGGDLLEVRARLLDRLARDENDANALLDLSTVLHLMGHRDCGLSLQALALQLRQVYALRTPGKPAGVRLLALLVPGDLTENNALEFLVEHSDVALDLLYVGPDLPFPETLPEHDLAIVAVCESDRNRAVLEHLDRLLAHWPKPVICAPDRIAALSRDGASTLLRSAPEIVMPPTVRLDRQGLATLSGSDAVFPAAIRPVDSHKGKGLAKVDGPEAIPGYLAKRPEGEFYVTPYVDYRGPDGQFRKYRVVLIDGRPYACHMAISENWIVHYMSAKMLASAGKRAEEAEFFAGFDRGFARRHHAAFRTLAERVQLEYFGIDCAEMPDGQLLVFEVDSGMTVHAMDPVDVFPYKQPQMQKVFRAFRRMLVRKAGKRLPGDPPQVLAENLARVRSTDT